MQFQARGRGAGRWIAFGVIAFGALFFVIGLITAGMSISLLANGERAQGTVVSLDWQQSSSGSSGVSHKTRTNNGPMAHPVVEFTAADGKSRTFTSSSGSNPPSYDVGERVEVLYRADSPEDAQINGFASLWLLPLVFGGLGLLAAGIGTGVVVAVRRRS